METCLEQGLGAMLPETVTHVVSTSSSCLIRKINTELTNDGDLVLPTTGLIVGGWLGIRVGDDVGSTDGD
jgi:hypothetical protein